MQTKIVDGKTFGKIENMRIWPKNPRIVKEKDLTRLEQQICELGLYKPLLVTYDGEILGGNQRFKVLQTMFNKAKTEEDKEKRRWVWISVIDAGNDELRLKYALSDNDSIGKYHRDRLQEILSPFIEQKSLFADYNINIQDEQSINKFIDNLTLTENQLKLQNIEKILKEAGVKEDIIEDVKDMTEYSNVEEFKNENIIGCGAKMYKDKKFFVMKLIFAEENEEVYKKLLEAYKIADNIDGNLFKCILDTYGNFKGNALVKSLNLIQHIAQYGKILFKPEV